MMHDDLVLNIEAALLSAGRPVALDELIAMFEGRRDAPDRSTVREAVATLAECWRGRALELSEVASGYRAQIRREYSESIAALWQERPVRYSRALLETLALIAYRQPVSRGEIEAVRGVTVSSSIMKTLLEREWVRVVGHRETPGRPALYGTTKQFLDTFNLKSLEALPPLAELRDLDDPPPDLFTGLQDAVDDGEGAVVNDEDSAVGGEDSAVGGEDSAVGGEDSAVGGEDSVDGGEDSVDGGEDSTVGGEDSAVGGEDSVDGGEDSVDRGEDAVVDGGEEPEPSALAVVTGTYADDTTAAGSVNDGPPETVANDGSAEPDSEAGADSGGSGV